MIGTRFKSRNLILAWFAALSVCGICSPLAGASPGQLDSSFGNKGIVIDPTPQFARPFVSAVLVERDGAIVVAVTPSIGLRTRTHVVRYLRNGDRDPKFHGVSTTEGPVESLKGGPNGSILLVHGNTVERLLHNGYPDPSFGAEGAGRATLPGFAFDALAVQPDGRIVAGGSQTSGGRGFAVVRLLPDGALDPTFGTAGITVTPISEAGELNRDLVHSLTVQASEDIIAAGRTGQGETANCGHCLGPNLNTAIARYTPDGTLDPGFGEDGVFEGPYPWGGVGRVLSRPNGGVVFSVLPPTGTQLIGAPSVGLAAAQLTPNGRLDPAFGLGGFSELVNPYYEYRGPTSYTLIPQPHGRVIIVGGNTHPDEFLLGRLNSNGSADKTFGSEGLVYTRIGKSRPYGTGSTAAGLGSSGRIVVAGAAPHRVVIARYLAGR